ncbi:hypothetical protein H9P43_005766 [Blastocladiella emersonii ATCC 22665]|nr:hypothetical protein H9P43_005766 [Blastocladiella emersonii ATCC 22665]
MTKTSHAGKPFNRSSGGGGASSSSHRGGRGGKRNTTSSRPAASSNDGDDGAPARRKRGVQIKDGIAIRKSASQLKQEIRMTDRFLAKKGESLDAFARTKLETKLAALRGELTRVQGLDKDRVEKFDQMYRTVKFVERVKATRQIAKLRRTVAESAETDRAAVQAQLDDAILDLLYVMHFPAATKYVALWPEGGVEAEDAKTTAKRAEYREQIRALADAGVIDAAETVNAVVGEEGEKREKQKTKKKGFDEEEIKHAVIGNMLRGVMPGAGSDDEGEEETEAPARTKAAAKNAADEELDNDDFFMD